MSLFSSASSRCAYARGVLRTSAVELAEVHLAQIVDQIGV